MANRKYPAWMKITGGLAVVALAIVGIVYGNGRLNLGSLTSQPVKKVARVAEVTCPTSTRTEGSYCVSTLEPLEYFVIKDGSNFVIYGSGIDDIFAANNWKFDERTFSGDSFSVAKSSFTPMVFNFKYIERDGVKEPAFVFDYTTAQNIQGSRFVEVELPDSFKIRFNTFNIPDKSLNNR